MTQERFSVATTSIDQAKADMDAFGYCLLKNALSQDELEAVRARLLEQLAAEEQQGYGLHLPDRKQLVRFLINKGKVFEGIVLHEGLHAVLNHVLGESYLCPHTMRISPILAGAPISIPISSGCLLQPTKTEKQWLDLGRSLVRGIVAIEARTRLFLRTRAFHPLSYAMPCG